MKCDSEKAMHIYKIRDGYVWVAILSITISNITRSNLQCSKLKNQKIPTSHEIFLIMHSDVLSQTGVEGRMLKIVSRN